MAIRKEVLRVSSLTESGLSSCEKKSRTSGKCHLGNLGFLCGLSLTAPLKNCWTKGCLAHDTPEKAEIADTCTQRELTDKKISSPVCRKTKDILNCRISIRVGPGGHVVCEFSPNPFIYPIGTSSSSCTHESGDDLLGAS